MRHQVILIGKDITSSYHGIKELKPDHIHLLFTNETKDVADPMYPLLPEGLQCTSYLVQAYDAQSVINVCREIHENFSGHFYYNLSEGTKLMAFAAYTVARENEGNSFYLTQKGELIMLDTFENCKFVTRLENEEILRLHGNILLNFYNISGLSQEDVEASIQVKNFIEHHAREHERLQSFYNSQSKRKLELLPKTHVFDNDLRFVQEGGTLVITLRGELLLHLATVNGALIYFDGRWWEFLLAEQVRQWSLRQKCVPEVWQNVIFYVNESNTRVKNEIDILINNGQKLIFIECKSGNVTQNDVYKVDAIREIYGGDISKAILASYYPIKTDLLDKCDDLQIHSFAPSYFAERLHFFETLPDWLDELVRELQI